MSSPPPGFTFRADVVDTIASGAPVSITILRDALKIAENPTEIPVFYNSDLVSACIRLVQERSKDSPILDDEFCVSCLKIIVICLQVANLVVCETIDAFIEQASLQPGPNLTLGEFATFSLYDRFQAAVHGPEPALNPFMTVANAVTLIQCLHRERGRFLHNRCAFPEFWSGWSFILLPAWLYLVSERISDQAAMAQILGDLACRFAAGEFSYIGEEYIVEYFAQTTHTRFRKITRSNQGYHLGYTSLQDSELLVKAVSAKFSTGSPTLNLAYYLQLWAGFCSSASRLDLMFQLMEASFTRLWHALDSEDFTLTYEQLRGVAEFSGAMLGYIMSAVVDNPLVPQAARHTFVGAALKHDIFGLLARTLTFPLPCIYSRMEESGRS